MNILWIILIILVSSVPLIFTITWFYNEVIQLYLKLKVSWIFLKMSISYYFQGKKQSSKELFDLFKQTLKI